jgi:hypothetical protein
MKQVQPVPGHRLGAIARPPVRPSCFFSYWRQRSPSFDTATGTKASRTAGAGWSPTPETPGRRQMLRRSRRRAGGVAGGRTGWRAHPPTLLLCIGRLPVFLATRPRRFERYLRFFYCGFAKRFATTCTNGGRIPENMRLRPPGRWTWKRSTGEVDVAFDSEPKLWQKKKPRPTIARRTGRHTDLAFPRSLRRRRQRGGGA